MKRKFTAALALTLALLLGIASTAIPSAAAYIPSEYEAYTEPTVKNTRAASYASVPVDDTVERMRGADARLINSTTYVPIRFFCEMLTDCKVSWSASDRIATVSAKGLHITAAAGSRYICANGRYLYSSAPNVVLDDNRLYVPVRVIASAFGVDVEWNASLRSVSIKGEVKPILSGDIFYDKDEVYWLSRIISSESCGEPFIGQIAVGNVVLNRVRSKQYPNTIWGVIFDRKYGVQFSPVSIGTIYNEPYYTSVIAAKICLEGYTISEDILYFFDPYLSTSNWISDNRPYAFTIGGHYFYY